MVAVWGASEARGGGGGGGGVSPASAAPTMATSRNKAERNIFIDRYKRWIIIYLLRGI